jgi:hypothetical protein
MMTLTTTNVEKTISLRGFYAGFAGRYINAGYAG